MSRAMKWYERPSGRLIHAVLSTGTTGTATELAVLAGIAETSAQRICKLMVCCGDGHVCGNRARKGNGPPPNVYKLGPAPSSVEDDDEDIAQAGCSNTLTAAIKNALSGTATRIVMSGKTVWRRDCGIDHKAIALINQTLRPLV